MPYIISVIIDFDIPGQAIERTTQFVLRQEESPTMADIEREMPGVIQAMIQNPTGSPKPGELSTADFRFEVEAIYRYVPG